jgi:2-haloacid dehalogenase
MIDRRTFLASVALAGAMPLARSKARPDDDGLPQGLRARVKAVAFDGFPIIDPQPVATRAEEIFPGRGAALMNTWRNRQFEYAWLRTLSGHYADFWRTTEDALVFAADANQLPLSVESREDLMSTFLKLGAWPDARPALAALHGAGIRMAFLSNLTPAMLDAAVSNAHLQRYFEPHLSTDRVRAYKPDPRAYAMAMKAFAARRDEIIFCASAGWDAAGARLFGYRTFWVNRTNQLPEKLGASADGMGTSLEDFVRFVLAA